MRKLNRIARKSVERSKSADPRLSALTDSAPRPSVDSQARSFLEPDDIDIDFDFDMQLGGAFMSFPSTQSPVDVLCDFLNETNPTPDRVQTQTPDKL